MQDSFKGHAASRTFGGHQTQDKISLIFALTGGSAGVTGYLVGCTFLAGATTDIQVGDGCALTVYQDISGLAVTTGGTGSITTGDMQPDSPPNFRRVRELML